ncbi:hypothetical protein SRHO_G00069480 [Serrasalmus rhombeus]
MALTGPRPLPFVGNVFTGLDFRTINKLAEEYGEIFSLRWGSDKVVFISGYKMVKEALITQLDSFADRPAIPMFQKIFQGLGGRCRESLPAHTCATPASDRQKPFELSIQQESVFMCDAFKDERGK